MNNERLKNDLSSKTALIDLHLEKYLPEKEVTPSLIHEAMRYSIFAGGKRLRPVLVLSAIEAVGGEPNLGLPVACALECIHTYSLIHDDLPAMDNDDYRRGKLTNHKVFGEATAILAGDALLTLAFQLVAEADLLRQSADIIPQIVREISRAAGSQGMIGGQIVDMQSENKNIDEGLLEYIHSHKTGALFSASVRVGALVGGASPNQIDELTRYSDHLGLAFQITDDILDVEGDSQKLGKSVGSDQRKKKCTYPAVYGIHKSREMALQTVNLAMSALDNFGPEADALRYIAVSLINREN